VPNTKNKAILFSFIGKVIFGTYNLPPARNQTEVPMLPKAMVPYLVFGGECLDKSAQCPGCLCTFPLGDGVVYQTYFKVGEVEHYGYLAFCSTACVVKWTPEKAFGHA
jgi:hypothetical protein